MTGDPATQQWRLALGESTSARLRRVEAELGAALGALAATREQLEQLKIRLAHTDGTGPCAYRALAVDAMRERDYVRAQLDDLIAAHGGGQ